MADRARPNIELAKLLDGLTDLEKVQAAQDVAATTTTPGWLVFVQLLEGRRAQHLDRLVSHVPLREVAEYAAELARVRELDVVLDVGASVAALAERAERALTTEGAYS